MALLAGGALTTASCSSDLETMSQGELSKATLKLEVKGVNQNRAIITGTTLPNSCSYGVFVTKAGNTEFLENGFNAKVDYKSGKSTLAQEILLTEPANVFAYYPYREGLEDPMNFQIEAESQTDYLIGGYFGEEKEPLVVEAEYRTAYITFSHVMARVTFKICKAEGNSRSYDFSDISLNGVAGSGSFDVLKQMVVRNEETTNLAVSPGNSKLNYSGDYFMADYLVIPSTNTSGSVTFSLKGVCDGDEELSLQASLPQSVWESGKQYTYVVKIDANKHISISTPEITLWNNNTQGGIEVGTGNHVK